jgi:enoyl-CoA hydratase
MIEIENRGAVALLRMAAGKGNALNLDLVTALSQAIADVERGPARAVILTGHGKVFGAGVDLTTLVAGGPDYVRRFLPAMLSGFEQLVTFPKPLIAAVNGHAIAGGAIIMLAADQRLLARGTAQVGLTEIRVGVQFPAWALEIARFTTPPQHFQTLIGTGRTWPPEQALSRGLVDELVESERLIDRAFEIAEEMAAIPAPTFAGTKLAVRRPLIEAARREAAKSDAAIVDYWCQPEVLKHISEFAAQNIGRRG